MELVSGGDLLNRVSQKGKLSVSDTRFYTAEIACGLFFLHGCDVVHRDLKLENVMLDSQGHVKITDFGLAKTLNEGEHARYVPHCVMQRLRIALARSVVPPSTWRLRLSCIAPMAKLVTGGHWG